MKPGGPNILVSRVSDVDGSRGSYSFVFDESSFAMYLTIPSSKQPLFNYKPDSFLFQKGKTLVSLSLYSEQETEKAYAFVMGLSHYTNESTVSHGEYILSRPKYNSTYSMFRLESDGKLKAHAYYEHVDWDAWKVSFRLFGIENGNSKSECRLLRKCGELARGLREQPMRGVPPRLQGPHGLDQELHSAGS